jgi:hypothetical protein
MYTHQYAVRFHMGGRWTAAIEDITKESSEPGKTQSNRVLSPVEEHSRYGSDRLSQTSCLSTKEKITHSHKAVLDLDLW